MANDHENNRSLTGLSPAERELEEAEERRRIAELANQITQRWDPSALGRVSVSEAGRIEKLDDATRHHMESRLGSRFDNVRVVRGAFADRITKHHRADALTVGSTGLILVRDTPRTNFKTTQGKALLAHELTHVRQAQRGMHFALEQNDQGSAHEQEASEQERRVVKKGGLDNGKLTQNAVEAQNAALKKRVFDAAVRRTQELLAEAMEQDRIRNNTGNDQG